MRNSTISRSFGLIVAAAILTLCCVPLFAAIKPENVAVIVNSNSKPSQAIGTYYCKQRGIPTQNLIQIDAPTQETISQDQYKTLAQNIQKRLTAAPLSVDPKNVAADKIQVLVTCYGIPSKILGKCPGATSETTSVDSFLTLLFNDNAGPDVIDADYFAYANCTRTGGGGPTGLFNPYYNKDQSFAAFRASTDNSITKFGGIYRLRYLVCRLDGYDDLKVNLSGVSVPKDVRDMIDRGKASTGQKGKFYLDEPWRGDQGYSHGRYATAESALKVIVGADNVIRDSTASATYLNQRDVMGYASFGIHDLDILTKTDWGRPHFTWKPGAVAIINESAGGQQLRSPQHAYGYKTIGSSASDNPKTSQISRPVMRVLVSYKVGSTVKHFQGYRVALLDYKNTVLKSAVVGSDGIAEIDLSDPKIKWPADHKTKVEVYYPDKDAGYHDGSALTYSTLTFTPDDLLWNERQQSKGRYAEVYLARQCSAEYIRDGCSGINAAVSEPGADFVNADVTLPQYAKGYTWAEAAYMGTRHLGFKTILLGDPLMAPFGPVKSASAL